MLPGGGCSILCQVSGQQITPLQEVNFDFDVPHLIGGNNWLVYLTIAPSFPDYNTFLRGNIEEKHPIHYRTKITEEGGVVEVDPVELPNIVLNKSMALYGDILYLGGYRIIPCLDDRHKENWGEELAGFINLSCDKPKWQSIPVPADTKRRNFEVLLVNDNMLWLVNDLECSDYIAEFDVSTPTIPLFIRSFNTSVKKFTSFHSFSSVRDWRMSIDRKWVAVHEYCSDNYSSTDSIHVYQLPTFKKVLSVSQTRHNGIEVRLDEQRRPFDLKRALEEARSDIRIVDFCVTADQLLIACAHHGLTMFSLADAMNYCTNEEERKGMEADKDQKWKIRREAYKSVSLSIAVTENNQMPRNMDSVDRIIPLQNGGVVAISFGETGTQLLYKVLA